MIKVITGVRRCGKSSLMKLIIKELLSSGVKEDNILYLHLDKKPYTGISTQKQLDSLIEKLSKGIDGKKYLFIDEIQNVKDFETVINSWREEGDYSIFITGSNSYLLSGELVTKLTGRYIEFGVLPLTFDEYVKMKSFLGKQVSTDALDELEHYIYEGGFPFALKLNSIDEKREYTQNLIEEIYEKDVHKRIRIRNRSSFDMIMRYFINNFGATTSVQNIVEDLKKQGNPIKKSTVYRYIDALKNAKILLECNRFDLKSRKSLQGEQKYYLSDLSFYYAYNTDNRINYGPVLENILYNYALSLNYRISIGRIGKLEVDFILRDNKMNYSYVQVAYTILSSKKTEDREYAPLENIKDNYPKYVMTTDRLRQMRNGVIHCNIMDFMMKEKGF
ncbi:MAG: ATP-binding protein [Bacilli bacterium]|nr:ATP-binding protein [Bacilli bacterium]